MTERTAKLKRELGARRTQVEESTRVQRSTIETSEDPDEILNATRSSLEARGELKVIERAITELESFDASQALGVEYKPGVGGRGRAEAARRFAKAAKR